MNFCHVVNISSSCKLLQGLILGLPFHQDSERWLASLQKSIREQTPHLMPVDEVEERLREAVQAHPYNVAQAFSETDYANMGVVSKDDFKSVVSKTMLRLSDEQVSVSNCSVQNA